MANGSRSEPMSVALCTFNGARYLREQLESIRTQTRVPDRIVLCDDASTDETPQLLRDFAAASPIPVTVELGTRNLGSTNNFARAISLCPEGLIVLADQDDRWLPQKLERLQDCFEATPQCDVAFSDAFLVDESGARLSGTLWRSAGFLPRHQQLVGRGESWRVVLQRFVATGATMAFRSRLRGQVLPIPESWVHDAWILLVASAADRVVRVIPEPLIEYRVHAQQQIGVQRLSRREQFAESLQLPARTFGTEADRWQNAVSRAQELFGESHRVVIDLMEKCRHLRSRGLFRSAGLREFPQWTREYLSGRYSRCSDGWKSAVTDLVAACVRRVPS